jgi:chemotaxis protein methyltransferase WspC
MLDQFERLLARHMGLDAESVGRDLIARAVLERRRASDAASLEAYWQLVSRSPAELQALIEAVVVVETWFFRDPEAFACLAREASEWLASSPLGALRVLSLPCATGEEPYSIAIALLDAGVPAERLAIEGVDISAAAIARARRGVYGNNAFRSKDVAFRARHFDPVEGGFLLRDAARAGVTFRSGNMLGAELALQTSPYHAIFCRNLLIYLDANAQRQALDVLARLLAPEGLLFVGPSETNLLGQGFSPLRVPLAFGFRKQAAGGERRPSAGERRSAALVAAAPPALTPARAGPSPSPKPSTSPKPSPQREAPASASGRIDAKTAERASPLDAEAHLDLAASLADRGQLAEAFGLCADHERLHGTSARLFYLMGLLREAQRRPDDAATFLEKAIYLDPHHREALTHLALLLERRGDAVRAERLRRRAQRSSEKEGS